MKKPEIFVLIQVDFQRKSYYLAALSAHSCAGSLQVEQNRFGRRVQITIHEPSTIALRQNLIGKLPGSYSGMV